MKSIGCGQQIINAFHTCVCLCVRPCVCLSGFKINLNISFIYKDIFIKFAGNVYGYKNLSLQNFGLILKNKMATIANCLKVIIKRPVQLRRFQHFTCHIMTGGFVGRGNQYMQLVKVLYCKLPAVDKKATSFPRSGLEFEPPTLEMGGECVTTVPP